MTFASSRGRFATFAFVASGLFACTNVDAPGSRPASTDLGTTRLAYFGVDHTLGGFTGGTAANPGCQVCGGDFTDPTLGTWNGGDRTFTDTSPADAPVTKIVVTVRGEFEHAADAPVTLNGTAIGTLFASPGILTCACTTERRLELDSPGGIPNYVKGGTNTLHVESADPGLRIAGIIVRAEGAEATTVALTSNTPSIIGSNVVLNAAVTANGGSTNTVSGSVTFKEGTNTVGTGTLDGTGHATATLSGVALGSHTYTAEYAASTGFLASTSSPLVHVVQRPFSSVALTTSVMNPVARQSITFVVRTAAVAPQTALPAGNVTISEGSTLLATARLNGTGTASAIVGTLGAGTHVLTARTEGDSNYGPTTATLTLTIAKATTSIDLSATPSQAALGQNIGMLATVSAPPPAGTPRSGTVTYYEGSTVLDTLPIDTLGRAGLDKRDFPEGVHKVRAHFDGSDDLFESDSPERTFVVGKMGSSVTIAISPEAPKFGDKITVRGTPFLPLTGQGGLTGTVTFFEGSAMLGTKTLDMGTASLDLEGLHAGVHNIRVEYSGTDTIGPDVGSMKMFEIAKIPCDVTVVVTPSIANAGETIGFRGTVRSSVSGPLKGSVEFRDGIVSIGVADLDNSGVAVLATSTLAAGDHSIVAEYPGDFDHLASVATPTSLFLRSIADPDGGGEGGTVIVVTPDASVEPEAGAEPTIFDNEDPRACACRGAGTPATGSFALGAMGAAALVFVGLSRSRRRR
ncbi:MAG: Ig-like domain-containing protein [Polyangiaceae bacterium]